MGRWLILLALAAGGVGCGETADVCDPQSMPLSSLEDASQAHFSGADAWSSIARDHSVPLAWLDGERTQLRVSIDADFASAGWVDARRSWTPEQDECTHRFEIETRAIVSTDDGALSGGSYPASVSIHDAQAAWIRVDLDARDVTALIERFDGVPGANAFVLSSVLPEVAGVIGIADDGPDGRGEPNIRSIAEFP